jgi:hypothetical protein
MVELFKNDLLKKRHVINELIITKLKYSARKNKVEGC